MTEIRGQRAEGKGPSYLLMVTTPIELKPIGSYLLMVIC